MKVQHGSEGQRLTIVEEIVQWENVRDGKPSYLLGWSTRVDNLLAPYVEKSYVKYKNELLGYGLLEEKSESIAIEKAKIDLEQGMQGLEYKLNSVASSRGDYPSKH